MLGDYFEAYKKSGLRLTEFSLLVLIYEQNSEFLNELHNRNFIDYTNALRYLEFKGFAKQFSEKPTDIMLRKLGADLFGRQATKKEKESRGKEVNKWFKMWRELFPEGSNTAGYRYRGNNLEGLKKMIKFVDQYEFTKEEIFRATEQYVNRFAIRGYNYMQQAHYFIEKKDVGSTLASECEGLREQGNKPINKEPDHGNRLI